MNKQMSKKKYLLLYTLMFVLMFTACFGLYFYRYRKSLIWGVDGLEQQFTRFIYTGQWIHDALDGNIRLFDISLGYGSDTAAVFGCTVLDPFNWFAAIFPKEVSEIVFEGVTVLRMYCAGLAFSHYCSYTKRQRGSTLFGAMIYTFSAGLFIAFKQPDMVNVFILFPLLMTGVQRIWNRESPLRYIAVYSACMIYSYYFTYNMSIMILIYCIVRFIMDDTVRKDRKTFFRMFFAFLISSAAGFVIGMGFQLPSIMNMMSQNRLHISRSVPLIYSFRYISYILRGLMTSYNTETDAYIGLSAMVIICVFVMILRLKNNRIIAVLFAIETAALFIPAAGSLMNGFSYAAFRWTFVYPFTAALIAADNDRRMLRMETKELLIMFMMSSVFAVIICAVSKTIGRAMEISLILLCAAPLVLMLVRKLHTDIARGIVFLLTAFSLTLPPNYNFSWNGLYHIASYVDAGRALTAVEESGGKTMLDQDEDNIRYSERASRRTRNSSSLTGLSGIDFYYSYYNQNIDDFHSRLAMNTSPWNFGYSSLDNRSSLMHLLGVKYEITPADRSEYPAYGYEIKKDENRNGWTRKTLELYETGEDVSLVTSFTKTLSTESYLALKPYEREQALSSVIVLDECEDEYKAEKMLKNVSFRQEGSELVTVEPNRITVRKKGAQIYLSFDEIKNADIMVYFENLQNEGNSLKSYTWVFNGAYDHSINPSFSGELNALTPAHHMYGGKHDWLINTGHSASSVNEILITFNEAGEFTFDDMKIIAKPHSKTVKQNQSLVHPAEIVDVRTNSLFISLNDEHEEYVMISIPYSEGWTAYLDGEEAEILKADEAFMAVKVPKGKHILMLYFFTPYLITGLVISGAAMFAVFILLHFWRRFMYPEESRERRFHEAEEE